MQEILNMPGWQPDLLATTIMIIFFLVVVAVLVWAVLGLFIKEDVKKYET